MSSVHSSLRRYVQFHRHPYHQHKAFRSRYYVTLLHWQAMTAYHQLRCEEQVSLQETLPWRTEMNEDKHQSLLESVKVTFTVTQRLSKLRIWVTKSLRCVIWVLIEFSHICTHHFAFDTKVTKVCFWRLQFSLTSNSLRTIWFDSSEGGQTYFYSLLRLVTKSCEDVIFLS